MANDRHTCRLCGGALFPDPIFRLPNVPLAAQWLPKRDELERDGPVDLDIRQCSACGLIQLASDPVPYYREVITAASVSGAMLTRRRDQARTFVERFHLQGRRVLEVGCGEGYFLDLLEEAGAKAMGIEVSARARAAGIAGGRHILDAYLERGGRLDEAPFDGFVMLNFLEHAPDPADMLATIAANLAPGAVGLVEVPDIRHAIETELFYDFVPDHLSYFTEETLRYALEGNGFEVVESHKGWSGFVIWMLVRKRAAYDFSAWNEKVEGTLAAIDNFLRPFSLNGRRVAVWGASHFCLTLLAMGGIRYVHYVVDSAPFKQGRYTPVTHLPIVPPERLLEDPVAAILVVAGGYSDEIVASLLQRWGFKGAIAVLRDCNVEVVRPGPQ